MNPWLGLCANNNRGGIHSTWKHLPQVPWSPPCQGIHWNCHQDKHSALQITIIARQQLALLQLVGREWLISISPRGEGRKGTFPFSWAKKSGPGSCLVDLLCEANLPWTGSWCVTLAAGFVCTLNSSGTAPGAQPVPYCTRPLEFGTEGSKCGENPPKNSLSSWYLGCKARKARKKRSWALKQPKIWSIQWW